MDIESYKDNWTLFLDRDGVINVKLPNDYVKNINEFSFIDGSIEGIRLLSKIFKRIIIVTNQRGIGKKIMTIEQLKTIHNHMKNIIHKNNGRIDGIYYCADIDDSATCRKPNPGMALKALDDFPKIDFKKSIMVGDSKCDIEFGINLGMKTVLINDSKVGIEPDYNFSSLIQFSKNINTK